MGCQTEESPLEPKPTSKDTLNWIWELKEKRDDYAVTPSPTPVPTPEPTAVPTLAPTPVPEPEPIVTPVPQIGGAVSVSLSFYVCSGAPSGYQDGYCGAMASGNRVYEGAVACGYAFRLGQHLRIVGDPSGRTYVCEDRGLGPYYWLDVFFWDYSTGRSWRNNFGQYVGVELIN